MTEDTAHPPSGFTKWLSTAKANTHKPLRKAAPVSGHASGHSTNDHHSDLPDRLKFCKFVG